MINLEKEARQIQPLRRNAIFAILVLLCYYELYRWVPTGHCNGQFHWPVKNDQVYPDIVIGVVLITIAWAVAQTRPFLIVIGAALLALWTIVHVFDWWLPHIRGTGPGHPGYYHYIHGYTQILPIAGNHYPPDGGHAVLDFLIWIALIGILTVVINDKRGTLNQA